MVLFTFLNGQFFATLSLVALFIVCVSSLRKIYIIKLVASALVLAEIYYIMSCLPARDFMHYFPLLWILTISSGLSLGMHYSSSGRVALKAPSAYYVYLMTISAYVFYGDYSAEKISIIMSFLMYDAIWVLYNSSSIVVSQHGSEVGHFIIWLCVPYLSIFVRLVLEAVNTVYAFKTGKNIEKMAKN